MYRAGCLEHNEAPRGLESNMVTEYGGKSKKERKKKKSEGAEPKRQKHSLFILRPLLDTAPAPPPIYS